MKLYAKSISLMIVALFLGSIALTIVTENSDLSPSQLNETTISEAHRRQVMKCLPNMSAPIGVGPVMSSASPSLNEWRRNTQKRWFYISHFYSCNINLAKDPLNDKATIMDGGSGIPVSMVGDAKAPSTYHHIGGGTSNNVTQFYQNGGNMVKCSRFSVTVSQSENGNMMDIDITASYSGSSPSVVAISCSSYRTLRSTTI